MMIALFVLLLLKDAVAMESSKALEGYPLGYMSDCPGSTKESIITKKSLKHLIFATGLAGGRNTTRRYNYFQMKSLAKDPSLDFNRQTILFVSGYLDSPHFAFAPMLSEAYSNLGYNIISLDTNRFTTVDYPIACRLARSVGKHTAEMLANLTEAGLDPKKLHLIGLSLGGQTISFIAKNYRLLTGMNVSRLTGLDPAGPCFRHLGPDQRIDSSDADFVDIVATNIDGFGMAAPVGHVQFYVNGGEYQPGGPLIWYYCGVFCSHVYSLMIWLSALKNPKSFIGMQCDSVQQARFKDCYDRYPMVTNVLGQETDKSKKGIFYVATTQFPPYYLGAKGLKKSNDFMMKNMKSPNDIDIYVF